MEPLSRALLNHRIKSTLFQISANVTSETRPLQQVAEKLLLQRDWSRVRDVSGNPLSLVR